MNEMSNPNTGIGGNKPPVYDEEKRAELEAEARDLADAAGAWKEAGEITDEEQAEKANDFLAQARALYKKVEEAHKVEKKPYLDAGREVDQAFKPLLLIAEAAGKKVKSILKPWLDEQQRKADEARREAERKARAEAEAAERDRKAAEARNDVVGETEAQARAEEAEKAARAAEKESRARVGSATGGGKTASLRTVRRAVVDHDLTALLHYRAHPEVIALLERIATAEVRAKGGPAKIPGFDIITEKVL